MDCKKEILSFVTAHTIRAPAKASAVIAYSTISEHTNGPAVVPRTRRKGLTTVRSNILRD